MIRLNCSTVCVLEIQKSRKWEMVKINYLKCIHKSKNNHEGWLQADLTYPTKHRCCLPTLADSLKGY